MPTLAATLTGSGIPGNRIERCLSYDEKPLLLFQKLKDAKKNPVFMLKHIKDIRSPIAVAQQKQAARKATSETSSVKSPPLTGVSSSSHGHQLSQDRTRPPNLKPVGTPSGWPDIIMSPAVESKGPLEGQSQSSTTTLVAGSTEGSESTVAPTIREIPNSTGISYAVAIYPYMAEQDDEFDVVV